MKEQIKKLNDRDFFFLYGAIAMLDIPYKVNDISRVNILFQMLFKEDKFFDVRNISEIIELVKQEFIDRGYDKTDLANLKL